MLRFLLFPFLLLTWLLAEDGGEGDSGESDGDDGDEGEEGEEGDEGEDGDDDDEDGDDDALTPEEIAQLKADLKKANKTAERARRALKKGKRPNTQSQQSDDDAGPSTAEIRLSAKEALLDAGMSPKLVRLIDLDELDYDEDGDLLDPEQVVDLVNEAREDLGLTDAPAKAEGSKKKATRRRKPPARGGGKKAGDKTGDPDAAVNDALLAQIGMGGDD